MYQKWHRFNHRFTNRLMHCTHSNMVLQEKNYRWNCLHCRVEHVFGYITNSVDGKLMRIIGLARTKIKIGLMNLFYNFFRLDKLSRLRWM